MQVNSIISPSLWKINFAPTRREILGGFYSLLSYFPPPFLHFFSIPIYFPCWQILESKLEAGERNRQAAVAKNKEKMGEELAKVHLF